MVMGRRDSGGFGKAIKGFLIRKCLGVSTSNPSGSSGRGISGRGFKHTSICDKVVASSSYM